MGGTSGQSFVEDSAGLVLEQKGADNIEVGEKSQEESSHRYAACDNRKKPLIEQCVITGQFQKRLDIAEEVIEFVRVAKVQACSHERMHQCIKEAGDPGHHCQENTHLGVHDDSVAKRVADGHKTIKSHDGQ